ncbi:MAG: class I adenylate-forming enzyme family protein [Pseudomonadota bacterium]|nr:class I adenylate-forming enzyme family protein [Pseudomonadota bacterium]MEC8071336.1 class I adenylate-forming enzyme family protein [Pseudomonadota bacterium]MEE2823975.1 class I adenylate-forming enzyme family protein [Pseudomonadota bacterium]
MYQEYKAAWAALTAPGADFEVTTTNVRGVDIKTYANALTNLRDAWVSTAAYAEREYIVYEDERLTYAQAHEHVNSLGNWLIGQGVQPGDRVAIAMRNYPEWILSYWAILSVGATVVGMNAWWTGPEMLYALEDSTPKAIIADEERLATLNSIRAKLANLVVIGVRVPGSPADVTPWSDVIADPTPMPEIAIDPDSDACIFYTSGTTGNPKGAQLTHRGCTTNIWSLMFAAALQRVLAVQKGLIEADAEPPVPSALVTTPLFHVTANNCVAHGTTLAGGKLTHMYKWDAGVALKLIEQEKISALSGVPVMAREVISHPDFATTDTSSLMTLGGGGAQLQPDLVGKIDEQVATARPNTGYGMTETCGIITSIGADYFVDKPASCGPAMPAYETKVVDPETGEERATGEAGELWVRGGHVIRGYLNRPDATAETIVDGWLRTGDMAREDEDGFLYIVDRIKDMVLRGGENIYCAEVESAIFDHPAVAECTVFGVEDDRLGEEVGAAIYLSPGQTANADEIRDHLLNQLAKFKIPRYIWFTDTALPRNASGKFLKRELRETLKVSDSH